MNDSYKDTTTATYDLVADDYVTRDTMVIKETEEVNVSLKAFAKRLATGKSVLDVGCGGGRDSRRLSHLGVTVTAIDISQEMLTRARQLDGGPTQYVAMDLEDITFPADTFDGVWANATLHHIPKANLPAVLQSLYRILKPGGIIQIKVHHGRSEGMVEEIKFNKPIQRYFATYEPEELKELLEDAGFTDVHPILATGTKWVDCTASKPSQR